MEIITCISQICFLDDAAMDADLIERRGVAVDFLDDRNLGILLLNKLTL